MRSSEDSDSDAVSVIWTESTLSKFEAVLHPNKKLAAKDPWRVLPAFLIFYK